MLDEEFRWKRIVEMFIHLDNRLECVLGVEEGFGDCVALGYQAAN